MAVTFISASRSHFLDQGNCWATLLIQIIILTRYFSKSTLLVCHFFILPASSFGPYLEGYVVLWNRILLWLDCFVAKRNLKDCVSDMLDLQQGPVHIAGVCRPVDVKLACFVCDAPARAFVKQVKGHSGYYGCEKCTQKGQWGGKVIFPDVNAPLRTDVLFDDMRYANHKTGQSPLQTLSVGMISQFPLDYMHLVCLGVLGRLLWFWTKSPFSAGIRISPNATRHISENLRLKNFIPREFSRKWLYGSCWAARRW